jgi:hypothetical protein
MDSIAFPLFCRVTVWAALVLPTAWLANVSDAGVRLTAAAGAIPVPFPPSATLFGLVGALLVTVKAPLRVPSAVGEKLTLIAQ